MLLQGLFVPLLCPFYRDGALYLRKLEHNVARLSLGPAAGLVALPPGGEALGLSDAEATEMLRTVAESAAKEKVLLAGVQRASVRSALAQIESAAEMGYDAALLTPPVDWARLENQSSVQDEGTHALRLFYQAVADRSPLPIVLWSDATSPGQQLPMPLLTRCAEHTNLIGMLDENFSPDRVRELRAATAGVQREVTVTPVFEAVTRRMLQPTAASPAAGQAFVAVETLSGGGGLATLPAAAPAMKTRSKVVGFQLLAGGQASTVLPLLQAGVAGLVPVSAACAPQACFEVYAAWKDGDAGLAEEKAERLGKIEALLAAWGVSAVKFAADLNGYFGGQPRLPRLPLTADQQREVERALGEVRN